jgi:hypothetical protein
MKEVGCELWICLSGHRQRIGLTKAELQDSLGKPFSQRTLVPFLKNLTADTNPCGGESKAKKSLRLPP